mgnify:CR=1 FL=1
MRRIQIQHLTRYQYAERVTLLPHTLHLRPREGHDIRVQSSRLVIDPAYRIRWKRDVYSNSVAMVEFLQPAQDLVISSEVVVEHYEEEPLEFVLEDNDHVALSIDVDGRQDGLHRVAGWSAGKKRESIWQCPAHKAYAPDHPSFFLLKRPGQL